MGRKVIDLIKQNKNILNDIKVILNFYQKLGLEYLPIKIENSSMKDRYLFNKKNQDKTIETLLMLKKKIGNCKRCNLYKYRTNIVFGEGNHRAKIMFIGEAPGREEDLQGRPFVGEAGMLLTRLIEKMGYKRSDVYISNIVKCRPPMNRDPEIEEIQSCKPFLEKQIEIIKPKVIISLGRISVQTLMDNRRIKITRVRGKFFDYNGIPVMPTFHPAYLIRNPRDKWLTWKDAQKVIERIKKS